MVLDIAFAFLVLLGYLVAIIMAAKNSKNQQITLSLNEEDIELIAAKVVERLSRTEALAFYKSLPKLETGALAAPIITMDESPVVVKSKTDGMELGDTELGKVEETEEKVSTSTLAALKGKKLW